MQFLEGSVYGLRSAFYELHSPQYKIKILLFPMLHIGDISFYENVSKQVNTCDNLIYEGVSGFRTKIITFSYGQITKNKSLKLVVQREALTINKDRLTLIHGDISEDEFNSSWRKLPLKYRLGILFLAPQIGIKRYLTATRASIAKGHTVDSRMRKRGIC